MIKKEGAQWWSAILDGNAGHRPVHQIREDIQGVESFLNIEPRARVLDLACGAGQQTLELSRRGYRVLGIDPSPAPIHEARQAGRSEKLNVHFLKGDIRNLAYRAEFDAVVSLGSSFGRFDDERDDLKVLEGVRRGLKPRGKLLLDLPSRERLIRRFEAGLWEREKLSFDWESGRLRGPRASLRVYVLTEIKNLIARAGLVYQRAFGDFDGSAYGPDGPRLIVLAEKSHENERPLRRTEEALVTAIRIKGRR